MEELSESAYYDENKAIDFILSGLGDNSVCGRKDILSVIDAIFDFYEQKGFFNLDNLDGDDDFSEDELLGFVGKTLKRRGVRCFGDDEVLRKVVRLELEYEDSINL